MLRALRPASRLPRWFVFGVATADHQCEAYDPGREDVRDVWERARGLTTRGRATDFWNRYAEDVVLAQSLGCAAFRFSIAWSRVEPEPGQYDEAALDHYRQLVAAVRAAGMEPIVTLHHLTWPLHVEKGGGMVADDFPAVFERYAAEVAGRLGRDVRYWITFNEPTQLLFGYVKPWWERDYFVPPGLPEGATLDDQMEAVGGLIRNLFRAHTLARAAIKRANPDALVGANPLLLGLPVWLQRLADWNATRVRKRDDLVGQGKRFAERPLLEQGAVDVVVANLTATPERAREVAFSDVYYVAGQRLLVKTVGAVAEPRDLMGRPVAVVDGSTAQREVGRLIPKARARVAPDYAAALASLERGQADAILADDAILRGLMLRHPGQYRLVGDRLTDEPYAAAVARGSREWRDAVNAAVRRFKESGEWAESYARHLGEPVPEPPEPTVRTLADAGVSKMAQAATGRLGAGRALPLARSGTALRRIQDRGYVVVAVKSDVPGFGYRDPKTGELGGLEIDLAREIARLVFGDRDRIRFRPTTTRERIPLLRSIRRLFDPLLRPFTVLSTMLTSNWWHLGMAGKLPEFLCPRECVGQQDFVGLDYYWGIQTLRLDRLQRLVDAGLGRFDRAPVWPGALHGTLKYHHRLFPNLPILIVENGSVDVADGVDRATYIRRHVRQVQRAVREGVRVLGYVCWSITSNREWGLKFGPGSDFGLYHVDLDADPDLRRVPTPAAAAYRELIAKGGA